MIAVIKGDIIGSRKISQPDLWLVPLKAYLRKWGSQPLRWEITGGDGFQLEINEPEDALQAAIEIKALLKGTPAGEENLSGPLDARLSIGIGEKTYRARRISESNGPAFVHAGDQFELLRKEKTTLALKSPFPDFDEEMNLLLKLATIFMDQWTVSSAALASLALAHPGATQQWLGAQLGIGQSSVSGRWNRAHVAETLEVLARYRKRLNELTA